MSNRVIKINCMFGSNGRIIGKALRRNWDLSSMIRS